MIEILSLDDITALRESTEIECKLANGRDGSGELPKDFWESYSAFANTDGGDIFLGLRENKDQSFELAGIKNVDKVLLELWNGLNNRQLVSANILSEQNVHVISIAGLSIIHVHVPRAMRKVTPVFIRNNPMTGSYRRMHSSDVLLDIESTKRMLAEQIEDSRDSMVLENYTIDDLDIESCKSYRQIYTSRDPDHPWNQVELGEFLFNIGVWRKDRDSNVEGLTRAGLLMFGKQSSIQQAFPNYLLDYQERSEANASSGWIDRLTLDGKWSGNLFDFYHRVIRKLTADLKVPFELQGDQRQDDTSVHKALREALVNTLVHADFSGRASILVVKRPDMFGFRNPGLMRVPLEIAMRGAESDCRNRLLHQMFRFIGLGEQAGSGLPRIYQGWREQHWRPPFIREKREPNEQTLLELHTLSLLPTETIQSLKNHFGHAFDALNDSERYILATADIEKTVDHARMMSVMDIHPSDLTKLLVGLRKREFLIQEGTGKGTIYFLASSRHEDEVNDILDSLTGPDVRQGGPDVSSGGLQELMVIANPIFTSKRASKEQVETILLELCRKSPLKLEELEKLTNRSGEFLRKQYLQPLIRAQKLRLKYPTIPNHPEQAYISK